MSTVSRVKCMICGGSSFTEDNPAVHYMGYTDHLGCFAKDFITKFCAKHKHIRPDYLGRIEDKASLALLNASWSALISYTQDDETVYAIQARNTKKQLEERLQHIINDHSDMDVAGIFRKGNKTEFNIVRTVHIVEPK